jgi:hypothetical protein
MGRAIKCGDRTVAVNAKGNRKIVEHRRIHAENVGKVFCRRKGKRGHDEIRPKILNSEHQKKFWCITKREEMR